MQEPRLIHPEIWLEVGNVAFYERGYMGLQLKNDLDSDRMFLFVGDSEKFKVVTEALKEKRPVHAKVVGYLSGVTIADVRISFAATRLS